MIQMFGAAHRLIQQIRHQSSEGGRQEQRLSYNVVSSLAATLQELTVNFRRSQNSYLKSKFFNLYKVAYMHFECSAYSALS